MSITGEEIPLWYVVHTYSGYENKVKSSLEKIIENRGLESLIFEVKIPLETVTEVSAINGGEKEHDRKLFPSYVLIKMIMNDETWHVVRNITGCTGFVGPGSSPVALTDDEVEKLGVEVKEIVLAYNVGDNVKICDGQFKDFIGCVKEISDDKKMVVVTASMFGRDTRIELSSSLVIPLEN